MPKYLVQSKIKHDGRTCEKGEVIELEANAAEQMPWAVQPLVEKKAEQNPSK